MYQIPTSLPEPTSTKTRNGKGSYGQVQRDVTTSWVLNPEQVAEGLPAVVVSLTTSHWGERKQYASMMTWETRSTEGAFSITTWGSDHMTWRPLTSPAARHSLKAMEAHHEAALAVVAESPGAFMQIFAEAADRNGLRVAEEV